MKIKKGDNVKVLSGRDAGKTGKVIQVIHEKSRGDWYVVVEGVNMRKKHLRARRQSETGRIIELSAPLHMSKVMLLDPTEKKPTRVGYILEGDSKKRIAKRNRVVLDS